MKNTEKYEIWRDKLLSVVSKQLCMPCTDKRKEQYIIDYNNPLNCDCHCDSVNSIIAQARKIDKYIKDYSN